MADNVHRKSHKQTSDRKIAMPVHRTTTETIRLGEQADRGHQSLGLAAQPVVNATANNQCRKKTSSFQITSVTVGTRMSNDAGDDSNDDLDESHTEDNSVEHSRVTDLDVETPSYSEDTFSKEDVFFNASNSALSTAPVIPTSSQYGLAIVPSEGNNPSNNTNDGNINSLDINSVTDNNIINLLSSNAKQDTDIREVHSHSRNERFKVVKIESTEPFKRGRWTCMDYLDHTSVNNPSNAINASKVADPNEVCISYGITDGGVVVDTTKQNNLVVEDKPVMMDMNGHVTHQEVQHSMMANPNAFLVGNTMLQNVQQLQQHNAHQMQPQVTAQIPQYFHQQMGSQQQQQQQQGATLPSNLQPIHSSNLGQPQSMPQVSIPIINQTNANIVPTQGMSHPKEEYITVGMQNQMMPGQNVCQTNVQQQSSTAAQPNILITQHPSQQQQQQQQQHPSQSQQPGHPQAQAQMSQISEPTMNPMMQQGIQNIHKVPQSAAPQQATATILGQQQQQSSPQPQIIPMPQQMQPQTSPGNQQQVQMSQVPTSCQTAAGGAPNTTMQQASMNFHQPETTEQDSVAASLLSAAAQQSADAILLESLTEVTQNNDDQHPLEDNESMSGTSAVAIDNKIEQAMDLVKSHLMFAVREEVEVLKEKIAELMDRINQLEAENLILKSHAAPEILAQLGGQTTTKLSQNNSGSGQ